MNSWNDSMPPINLWNYPRKNKRMLIVYSKKNCAGCEAAIMLLQDKGLAFEVVKIDEVPEAKEFILKSGHRTVPQIYEDGKCIGSLDALKNYLTTK
jgi:glutaredoxin